MLLLESWFIIDFLMFFYFVAIGMVELVLVRWFFTFEIIVFFSVSYKKVNVP